MNTFVNASAAWPKRNITGRHLIDEFARLAVGLGFPAALLRCGQRPQVRLRRDGRMGRQTRRPALHPTRSALARRYIESFNGRVRDECLNINMFWSVAQAHTGQ